MKGAAHSQIAASGDDLCFCFARGMEWKFGRLASFLASLILGDMAHEDNDFLCGSGIYTHIYKCGEYHVEGDTSHQSLGPLVTGSEGRQFESYHDHRKRSFRVKQAAEMVGEYVQNICTNF